MKVKRQRRVGKILKYFQQNFGFRKPFNMLLDGTYCAACLEAKVNIKEQMPKYVGEVKLMTTGCCISEIEALRLPQLNGATIILKGMPLFKCEHRTPLPAADCIKSLIKDGNPHHFIVGTQDPALRALLREVPGIPLIYLHGNAPTLEKPSELTESLIDSISDGKTSLTQHQQKVLSVLKKERFGEEVKPKKKKRKGPKGPNPLSCKKSKKLKAPHPSNENTNKKRRKKKKNSSNISV